MYIFGFIWTTYLRMKDIVLSKFYTFQARSILSYHKVRVKRIKIRGPLLFQFKGRSELKIGEGCVFLSGDRHCVSSSNPNKIVLWQNSKLFIGNNCGLSATSIACKFNISIGNNVKIGSGTILHDSDHHELDPERRRYDSEHVGENLTGVIVEDDVFIGANCTILKNVRIGEGSIIAAGSIVTKEVPSGEIWGGVPARYLKKL